MKTCVSLKSKASLLAPVDHLSQLLIQIQLQMGQVVLVETLGVLLLMAPMSIFVLQMQPPIYVRWI
jgi:hypothetical protein